LPAAVRMEESVVRAMARRAGRLTVRRTTNSATRCWASAAEPPLPATRSLWPLRMAWAVSSPMVTMVSVMCWSLRTACIVVIDWASCFWTSCFIRCVSGEARLRANSLMVRSGDFLRVPFFLRKNGHESIDSLYTLREFALAGWWARLFAVEATDDFILLKLLRVV